MRRRRLFGWLFLALGGLLASAFVAIQPANASVTPPITVVVTSNLPDRQAATWRYSDGFTLDPATKQSVKDATDAIVADAEANTVAQPPAPKLALLPNTLDGTAGNEIGPYTVTLVGAPTADISATGA